MILKLGKNNCVIYKNTETMLFGIASAMNTEGKKTTA